MEQEVEKNRDRDDETREVDQEKWVFDSSLDHKGNMPLRASTGVWRASLFIITIEFSERLTYFGIATNLITYLMKVLQQDLKTAAKNVNYWTGVTTIMPLFGGFLADAYFGRFFMIMLSSIIYLTGLSLLTMSEFIPGLKPCKIDKTCNHPSKVHELAFFIALYLLSLGTGGHKPCLESFGADQFDDNHLEERKQRMSFFNWWNFSLCAGLLLGATIIVYLQDYVSWGIANLTVTITMGVSVLVFYLGKPFYRYRVPEGSPLMPMLQVLVAAIVKRNLAHPSNPDLLYEIPKSQKNQRRLLCHTNNLRFLDKAAIIEGYGIQGSGRKRTSWRLATVTMVEETKLLLNMIPIWFTSLIFGVCLAQTTTFFVKQSSTMDRKVGNRFEIPPATIASLSAVGMLIAVTLYEKILVPVLRRATGNERGLEILQRIGIGMIFPVVAMAIAALVERKRLRITEKEIRQGRGKAGDLPMSTFWLAPQYIILGIGDAFSLVGLQEYFYEQVPASMRSLGMAFYLSVIGVGSFINSFLISITVHITDKYGTSWFGKDLNSSRLDKFYWLVTVMSGLNLCFYVFLAKRFSYKNVHRDLSVGSEDTSRRESMA